MLFNIRKVAFNSQRALGVVYNWGWRTYHASPYHLAGCGWDKLSQADAGVEVGDKVERRRREPSRGAEGAKGDGVWGGVSSSPQGEGCGEEAVPLPQNFFLEFWGQSGIFLCTLGAKFRFFLHVLAGGLTLKAPIPLGCQGPSSYMMCH